MVTPCAWVSQPRDTYGTTVRYNSLWEPLAQDFSYSKATLLSLYLVGIWLESFELKAEAAESTAHAVPTFGLHPSPLRSYV